MWGDLTCSMAVGGAVNAAVPSGVVLKPVLDVVGKVQGWISETVFNKVTADVSSNLICRY